VGTRKREREEIGMQGGDYQFQRRMKTWCIGQAY